MKKLKKLLSLLLVLALFVPVLNVSSAEEVDPALQYPLLTGNDYYNINNIPGSAGGVKDTIDFHGTWDSNGNYVNESAIFSVVSTGNYTAGQLSWKTTRIMVAIDFFDPATNKMTRMGYQFRPDELIKANNSTTTITINKEQAVAGIMDGMNEMNASLYALFPGSAAETRKAVAEAFENGCGLTINAEISKFYVPAGFESNRQLLVDAPQLYPSIWVLPQGNPDISRAENLKRLRDWGASEPSFKNPLGFANDAITRAKYQAGNAAFCGIPPLKDLEVTGLTVDIDEPTGDITCEASVENSFLFIK
ncbi:hypothetical protein [Acetoanaerobium noterae]|uniref:hypothetical protein n=1 Tax=Acetoanaerobium noterae TaxID=745369 RepID=UPI00324237BE